jgi:hypothetical protein
MAGELNTEINQLKIIVANKDDALKRLKELLSLAEIINAGTVTPALKSAIIAVYQAVNV